MIFNRVIVLINFMVILVRGKDLYTLDSDELSESKECLTLNCDINDKCLNRKFWCKHPPCPMMWYCSKSKKETVKGPVSCDKVKCARGYACVVKAHRCRWDQKCKQQIARCVMEKEYYEGPATCAGYTCPNGLHCILRESFCIQPPCKLLKSCAKDTEIDEWYEKCKTIGCPSEYECFLRRPREDCYPPCLHTPDCTRINGAEVINEHCRGWICPKTKECSVQIRGPCQSNDCRVRRFCLDKYETTTWDSDTEDKRILTMFENSLTDEKEDRPSGKKTLTQMEKELIREEWRARISAKTQSTATTTSSDETTRKGQQQQQQQQQQRQQQQRQQQQEPLIVEEPQTAKPTVPTLPPPSSWLNHVKLKTGIDAIQMWIKSAKKQQNYGEFQRWLQSIRQLLGPLTYELWLDEIRALTSNNPEFQQWLPVAGSRGVPDSHQLFYPNTHSMDMENEHLAIFPKPTEELKTDSPSQDITVPAPTPHQHVNDLTPIGTSPDSKIMNYQNHQQYITRWTTPKNYVNYKNPTSIEFAERGGNGGPFPPMPVQDLFDPLYYQQFLRNLISESKTKDISSTDEPLEYSIIIAQPDRIVTQNEFEVKSPEEDSILRTWPSPPWLTWYRFNQSNNYPETTTQQDYYSTYEFDRYTPETFWEPHYFKDLSRQTRSRSHFAPDLYQFMKQLYSSRRGRIPNDRHPDENLSDAEKYFFYRLYNENGNSERDAQIVGQQFGDEDFKYLEMMLKKNEELMKRTKANNENVQNQNNVRPIEDINVNKIQEPDHYHQQERNDIANNLQFWQTHHREFVQFLLKLLQRERFSHYGNRPPAWRRLNQPRHHNSEEVNRSPEKPKFNQRGPAPRKQLPSKRRRMFLRRFPKPKQESMKNPENPIDVQLQDSFQRSFNPNNTNSKKKVRYSIYTNNENDTNSPLDFNDAIQYDNSSSDKTLKEKLKDILEEQGFNVILTDDQEDVLEPNEISDDQVENNTDPNQNIETTDNSWITINPIDSSDEISYPEQKYLLYDVKDNDEGFQNSTIFPRQVVQKKKSISHQ